MRPLMRALVSFTPCVCVALGVFASATRICVSNICASNARLSAFSPPSNRFTGLSVLRRGATVERDTICYGLVLLPVRCFLDGK